VSTTRRIVRTESFSNWPNDPSLNSQNTNLTWSATNDGAGKNWTITTPASTDPSGNDQYGTVTLNTSAPESKFFTQTITTDDYRVADTLYNIPASRCSVDINMSIEGHAAVTQQGSGVAVTSQAEVIINGITYQPDISGTNTNYTLYRGTAGNLTQTGSDVTTQTASLNQNTIVAKYRQRAVSYNPNNSIPDTIISFHRSIIGGPFTRYWEADLHTIDGVVDSVSFDTCVSSMDVLPSVIKFTATSDLATTTTLQEISINKKIATPDVNTTDTNLSVVPSFIRGFTRELTVQSSLLASTENLVRASATLSAATTVSLITTFKPGVDDNFTSAVTAAFQGNLIFDVNSEYTWDSFNLNSYFVQGFAVDDFSQSQGEYNWTFLSTDSWDDWPTITWIGDESTWDNWPKDVWEEPYGLDTAGSMIISPAFKLGDVVTYNSAFTIVEDTALEEAAEADLASQFTTDFTAVGIIDVTVAISSAMSPSLTANIIYDLNDSSITITGAFSPVLTANAITDTFADIDVAFTFAVEPTFKPAGFSTITTASTFEQLVPTFKPGGFSAMVASAGTLTVGRLFFPADPYLIAHVSRELRKVVLPIENRQTLVMSENRLNTITQETSDYLVPQETRNLKLRTAPFKNRFSTPRVRQEQ